MGWETLATIPQTWTGWGVDTPPPKPNESCWVWYTLLNRQDSKWVKVMVWTSAPAKWFLVSHMTVTWSSGHLACMHHRSIYLPLVFCSVCRRMESQTWSQHARGGELQGEKERESTFCKHRIRSGMYEQGHTKVNSFWNFASGNSQQHRATSIVTSLHMYNVGHGSYKSSGVELDWVWVFEWDCNSQQSSFWEPVRSLHCPWSR